MTSTSTGTKTTGEVERAPFFLVLQQLGRRVLRPGGTAATNHLLAALAVGPRDDVVELAAGVGTTAQRLLAAKPKSYLAVEPEDRFAAQLDAVVASAGGRHISARAQDTGLPSASVDVVVGEAMLSMQPAGRRAEIIAEAARLLRPGGRYGIHELTAATSDPARLAELRRDLSRATQVAASPPPPDEWCDLLRSAGLEIHTVETLPLRLLNLRGVLADEGPWRSLLVLAQLALHHDARRRVRRTWTTHRQHRDILKAVIVVAEKPTATGK